MSKLSDRRLIENEVIFRNVNQSIQEFVDESRGANTPTALAFYCECSNPDCVERIEMETNLYSKIHKDSKHFITRVGHEFPEVEKVVSKGDNYQVVEKHFTPPKTEDISQVLHSIKK